MEDGRFSGAWNPGQLRRSLLGWLISPEGPDTSLSRGFGLKSYFISPNILFEDPNNSVQQHTRSIRDSHMGRTDASTQAPAAPSGKMYLKSIKRDSPNATARPGPREGTACLFDLNSDAWGPSSQTSWFLGPQLYHHIWRLGPSGMERNSPTSFV